MLEWLFIKNDLLLNARWSIIETFILFFILFHGFFWLSFGILRKRHREKSEQIARYAGFETWGEFRRQWSNDMIGWVAIFLLSVSFIYTFTHLTEVQMAYYHAPLADAADKCLKENGVLTCYKLPNSINASLFGVGFNYSTIINRSYPEND